MPVYERKLITPLAIRFTQEHIRTSFQDGRIVEDSIEDVGVSTVNVSADYDLVLTAPFPCIEILRWKPPDSTSDEKNVRESSEHWFTLDNRRLYCLQRAAMKYWPRRVAVEVDILYADHGRIWRKYDSTTFGHSVSIGHSCKGPEVGSWDWLIDAESITLVSAIFAAAAMQAAERDDQRASVDALRNADDDSNGALSSSLLRFLQVESSKNNDCSPGTASTSQADSQDFHGGVSEDQVSEAVDNSEADFELDLLAACHKHLTCGIWKCAKGMSYTIRPNMNGKEHWVCSRQGTDGSFTSFSLFYDYDYDIIWWGTKGLYFASALELHDTGARLCWYGRTDENMRRPIFCWTLQEAVAPSNTARLADEALTEIIESLKGLAGEEGYVWIDGWNERYGKHGLGQLKPFLQQYPDIFRVTPKRGKGFSVVLIDPVEPERSVNGKTKQHTKRMI